jgi:hypothetical protein
MRGANVRIRLGINKKSNTEKKPRRDFLPSVSFSNALGLNVRKCDREEDEEEEEEEEE